MANTSAFTDIKYDDNTGEYFIPLPYDILDELGWNEGDTLEFEYFDHHDLPGIRIHRVGV